MMDARPGGVAAELGREGITRCGRFSKTSGGVSELIEIYDNTASLQDRTVAIGVLRPALARQFGAGGYVGRASGRAFDARKAATYPPYEELTFDVPVLEGWRRQCTGLAAHPRGRREPLADRTDFAAAAGRSDSDRH